MNKWYKFLIVGLSTIISQVANAHTLGIDNSDLIELGEQGEYQLIVKVPGEYQPYIHTPILPSACEYKGDSAGERGNSQIRYHFACEQRLTSGDELVLPWEREGAMLTVYWHGREAVTALSKRKDDVITIDFAEYSAGSGTWVQGAQRYTSLGISHILQGLDHLLFVLALLFVVSGGRKLVKTITAFTVAHSITLGLATFGYLSLPSEPVEAAIALSIVFLCCEIVYSKRGQRGLTFHAPWHVAFAFGLLHGLGFAGALLDIGLPQTEIPLALLFFNVGVELGQLMFVAVVLLGVYAMRQLLETADNKRLFQRANIFVIYTMGISSSYWLIERTLLVLN
ncbi:HupE/UreJ family protein [Paraferrimonas sedimenticola]|uniref:HupE/UreJ family protein n=1 Tax=Paraferrimonas sedimenticola TaxID=375674 RepID=A0AA37RU19_9GAMM|nr:HupE/UreJ family protein [Paraferrimonas sedimenticola]GLP94937.1 hypothetical protein GCM10007895_02430 [Paraferrimonas sedimenticola]